MLPGTSNSLSLAIPMTALGAMLVFHVVPESKLVFTWRLTPNSSRLATIMSVEFPKVTKNPPWSGEERRTPSVLRPVEIAVTPAAFTAPVLEKPDWNCNTSPTEGSVSKNTEIAWPTPVEIFLWTTTAAVPASLLSTSYIWSEWVSVNRV